MAAPLTFGTAFATGGFTADPNLSPNNQGFSNAVLASAGRAGLPFGFRPANVVLAGPAAGAAALPAYRALTAADLPGGVNGFGNPTNLVSGTATNGTSTLAMRSDGAPALDWAQSPTWTGTHAFAGNTTVVGTATPYAWGGVLLPALQIAGSGGIAGQGNSAINIAAGMYFNGAAFVFTGTGTDNSGTSTGVRVLIANGGIAVSAAGVGTSGQTATVTQILVVTGTVAPVARAYGPTAGALVDMTPDTGSFNGTLGAVTTVITCPCVWARNGNVVVLVVGTGTGTSNANTFTLGGLPAVITPARVQRLEVPDFAVENSGAVGAITTDVEMVMNTNGTMTFLNAGTAANWGATLFKGVAAAFTTTYLLN